MAKQAPPASLEWYKEQFDSIAAKVFAGIRELGTLLMEAAKNLSYGDYTDLEAYLLVTWTKADLKAAVAVAKGEMDERLFPAGVRNSKVMSLTELDQQRLLSDEKFQVWGNDGVARSKSWSEMSPDERNRLLGPKGGMIHVLEDQRRPSGTGVVKVTVYSAARFDGQVLSFNGVKARGEIQAGSLRESLAADELAALIEALQS